MEPTTVWIGLDLGQKRTNICVVDDAGAPQLERACATSLSELEDALADIPKAAIGKIAVEAGNETHIIRKLLGRGYPVAIFESRKASRFLAVRRNKTDDGDAKGLADLARLGLHTVSQVYLKSLDCQQLRSQLAMRQQLVRLRVAAESSLRSRLALYGRQWKKIYASASLRKQANEHLASIRMEEGIDLSEDVNPLVDVCETLRDYIVQLDRKLERQAKQEPVCKRLMEVPGVGPICALSFYSAIEDPNRFQRSSDVAVYLGLVPRRIQSGEMSRTKGITKCGNRMTRSHLVTAATVFRARAPDCNLKQWALALKERIGPRRSKVALARKLAVVLLTMWKNDAHFELNPMSTRRLEVIS